MANMDAKSTTENALTRKISGRQPPRVSASLDSLSNDCSRSNRMSIASELSRDLHQYLTESVSLGALTHIGSIQELVTVKSAEFVENNAIFHATYSIPGSNVAEKNTIDSPKVGQAKSSVLPTSDGSMPVSRLHKIDQRRVQRFASADFLPIYHHHPDDTSISSEQSLDNITSANAQAIACERTEPVSRQASAVDSILAEALTMVAASNKAIVLKSQQSPLPSPDSSPSNSRSSSRRSAGQIHSILLRSRRASQGNKTGTNRVIKTFLMQFCFKIERPVASQTSSSSSITTVSLAGGRKVSIVSQKSDDGHLPVTPSSVRSTRRVFCHNLRASLNVIQ
jgi:hypothetical protein